VIIDGWLVSLAPDLAIAQLLESLSVCVAQEYQSVRRITHAGQTEYALERRAPAIDAPAVASVPKGIFDLVADSDTGCSLLVRCRRLGIDSAEDREEPFKILMRLWQQGFVRLYCAQGN
jgi:hypothetical protein